MTVGRVFVVLPAVPSGAQVRLALAAEEAGFEGVWVQGYACADPDTYATVTAMAVASVTVDLRGGVRLGLGRPEGTLRLAEDVNVLDHASSGRAEVWLSGPGLGAEAARSFARHLRVATDAAGNPVPVTPGALQPEIPLLVDGDATVELGRASRTAMVLGGGGPSRADTVVVPVASVEMVLAADGPGALAAVLRPLRREVGHRGATDIALTLPLSSTTADVSRLGAVVAPVLRAHGVDADDLVVDTLRYRLGGATG